MQFFNKWRRYLQEAQQDAKVLRGLNVKALQKEMPQFPEEGPRDYFARLQNLERDPEFLNPIFPTGLVDWVESLPDNHFPREGRKRFAKWLANAVYTHETETMNHIDTVDDPTQLNIHNNDIRYIVDYLNGADTLPNDIWSTSLNGMYDLSAIWHANLGNKKDSTGDYESKDVVYEFDNGFTIVNVKTENDLDVEGEKMGHCVGGYCDDVSSGRSVIYSLRDPKNRPHATIEVAPDPPYRSTVDQIKGKGNAPPVEKYRPMIKQWLGTTNFHYKESTDYLNILNSEEIIAGIEANEIDFSKATHIMGSTKDEKLIDYFLDSLVKQSEGILKHWRKVGGKGRPPMVNSRVVSGFMAMSGNRNMDLEQSLKFLKINLPLSVLGRQVDRFFAEPHPELGETRPPSGEMSSYAWNNLKEDITSDLSEEGLYYMAAIMNHSKDPNVREEIAEFILSEETKKWVLSMDESTELVFGQILQRYLSNNRPQKREMVEKIYDFSHSETAKSLMGPSDRLSTYIAESPAITDEIVQGMIRAAKDGTSKYSSHTGMKLIKNKSVSDSRKIELVKVIIFKPKQHIPQQGLHYSVYMKSFSRQIHQYAQEGHLSKDFLKWLTHSGIFDPYFIGVLEGRSRKLGTDPDLRGLSGPKAEEFMKKVVKLRDAWVKDILPMSYTPQKSANKEDPSANFIDEEVKRYFKKPRDKKQFYDGIKESLSLNEEKGRTRQRGIYKFYCMLQYGLTIGEDISRGLDDILADLRALPNVTIVTVAIRNQKISEGRYIAGLAVKYIPSTPGSMRTPEVVKARIVRDIKRLRNVQSLFKLSSGIIRLE